MCALATSSLIMIQFSRPIATVCSQLNPIQWTQHWNWCCTVHCHRKLLIQSLLTRGRSYSLKNYSAHTIFSLHPSLSGQERSINPTDHDASELTKTGNPNKLIKRRVRSPLKCNADILTAESAQNKRPSASCSSEAPSVAS